jgi:nucleotide-binding universal stress UspA family protein
MTGPANNKFVSLRRILVGTDLSPAARNALDWAIEIARAHDAEVAIVHAQETTDGGGDQDDDKKMSNALSDLAAAARDAGVTVSTEVRPGPA